MKLNLIIIIIMILSKVLIKILLRNYSIEKNDKVYNIIYIIGIYIPLGILIVTSAFVYTDTSLDFIIILFLSSTVLSSIIICTKLIYPMRYGGLSIPLVMFITFKCHIIAKHHLLCNLPSGFLICFICLIIAAYIILNNQTTYEIKLIKSTIGIIIAFIIIYTISLLNYNTLSNMSKPILYAFQVANEKGYDITSYDIIKTTSISPQHLDKYSPIKISIFRLKDYATTVRDLEIIYYKNTITNFKVNIDLK